MQKIRTFFNSSSASAVLLMIFSLLGIILANNSYSANYFSLLHSILGPITFHAWVNDVLMAIFFLLVGLEIKREALYGQLNSFKKRLLPCIAALFGAIIPALIYFLFAHSNESYIRGWAIPTATDIAFSLGVLSLLGNKVSTSLKVFMTALAIIDDLIAILVIAIFYSSQIHYIYIGAAFIILALLFIFNKRNCQISIIYVTFGVLLWLCIFYSGLHATLSGVLLALTIPCKSSEQNTKNNLLLKWEHKLQKWVNFCIIPVFGFTNVGIPLNNITISSFFHPVVLGVATSLFLGKQVGIFLSVFTMIKLKVVPMPSNNRWIDIYGGALLCGIGFTMSIFITILSFPQPETNDLAKLGVILGSLCSGIVGFITLWLFGGRLREAK